MKRIRITSTIALIGTTEDSVGIENEADIFDFNKIQVLNCFTSIEGYINHLLVNEFLGKYSADNKEQIEKFNSKIIHTSWFNFNEKRKMVVEILMKLEHFNWNKNQLEKSLRKIMSYRNMLAHGTFQTDGKNSELKYYEGEFKTQDLNDEFWDKVKNEFSAIFELLRQTLKDLEIIK